jgi:hypothetical protein
VPVFFRERFAEGPKVAAVTQVTTPSVAVLAMLERERELPLTVKDADSELWF